MVPKFGWYVLVTRPKPPIVAKESTPSVLATICSTRVSTAAVRSSEAPGGSCTLTPRSPWSSSGMNPAGSWRPSRPAPRMTTPTSRMVRKAFRTRIRAIPT